MMRYYVTMLFGLTVGALFALMAVRSDLREFKKLKETRDVAERRQELCDDELVMCLGYQARIVEALNNIMVRWLEESRCED